MEQTDKKIKGLEDAALKFAFETLDEVVLYGCTLSGRIACFKEGARWMMDSIKSAIKKKMEELWNGLPDSDKETYSVEETQLFGKYMMLEELDRELNGDKKEQYGKGM